MHLFITGGTGFFGKALLRHWATDGASELADTRFTLLSRNPSKFRSEYDHLMKGINVRIIPGDIIFPESLPQGDYTHILHAAADSTSGLSLTPLQRFDQIVSGTRNVLDLAVRCRMPRVLMISSGGVYGNIAHFHEGVPESFFGMPDPSEPQNAYSVAKGQAEHLCTLYRDAYGLDCIVARCFSFVGEDLPLNAHFAIGNFIRDVLSEQDIIIKGDGTPVRSYMDQRDLARWLTTLLLRGKSGRAYNVGSGEPISIAQLAELVAMLAPTRRPEIHTMGLESRGQAACRNFYLPNVLRAEEELGLRTQIGLRDSISHAINFLKQR